MRIAAYLRLSNEDIDLKDSNKAESESISNQRGLVRGFISSSPELADAEVIEFCDDGWSGKNFDRPGVTEMLEQVKQGKINCIIVKDLSRFGRDYLIVGNYISRVFPFLGVRFISVNDGFDSSRPQDIDSLDTSFKTLIYDLYSRELSRKVKSAKRQRAEKGLYLSPFAPYGYVKDPDNKNRLLIDTEAAQTIERIFREAADGTLPVNIAAALNREGIPTPMLYKRAEGCSRTEWPSVHETNFWTTSSITKLLRDERYIGKCVYGKRERDTIGNWHTVKKSKTDWVIVGETHEGIVSQKLFDTAQARMKEYKEFEQTGSLRNPLRRKVVCGVCGHVMRLSNTKNAKYHCSTASLETGYGCSHGGVLQADVNDAVIMLIRTYARYAVSLEHLAAVQRDRHQADKKKMQRELGVLQSLKNQLDAHLQELYEKLIEGELSREFYLTQKQSANAQMDEISSSMTTLEKAMQTPDAKDSSFILMYRKYAELDALTSEIVTELVSCIELFPDGRISITLNCRDELEALLREADNLPFVS
jgi:DNA invertase Pin-like site-specific DNA recombinase